MDLEDVDGHAAGGGELLVADVALEVLGLLVLHQDRSKMVQTRGIKVAAFDMTATLVMT